MRLARLHAELEFWNNILLIPGIAMIFIHVLKEGWGGFFHENWFGELLSLLFLSEWALGLWLSTNRHQYLRDPGRLLDVLSAIPLSMLFQGSRFLRITRLFRLLRAWIRTRHLSSQLQVLLRAGVVVATIAVTGAMALQEVEPEVVPTFGDALWWSIVTISTVGYGDLTPHTGVGRVIGSILIISGVGSFGYLAGFMTTALSTPPENPIDPVQEGLKRLEMQVSELNSQIAQIRQASQK